MSGRHAAIAVTYEGSAPECVVCGAPVDTTTVPVRHRGEALAIVHPEPADARAFSRAVDLIAARLAALPAGASRDDAARAAAEVLYEGGLLRRRPSPPRPRTAEADQVVDAQSAVARRYEPEPEGRRLARVS